MVIEAGSSGKGQVINTTKSSANVGAIAGGVVGGIAGLAALVLFIILWRRRQTKKKSWEEHEKSPLPIEGGVAPYTYSPLGAETVNATSFLSPRPREHRKAKQNRSPIPEAQNPFSKSSAEVGSAPTLPQPSPPSPPAAQPVQLQGNDSIAIRTEIERLRRDMEEMRASGLPMDPPPMYDSGPSS